MQEILFRGKTEAAVTDWVYGYYVEGNYFLDDAKMSVIIPIDNVFYPRSEINGWYEVYPGTVCQYIGLEDREGQKIFVGDILESPMVDGKTCRVVVKNIKFDPTITCAFFSSSIRDYKVVGNIFDTPDLIKGE